MMWQNPRNLLAAGFSALTLLIVTIILIALQSMNSIGNRFEFSAGREMEVVFALERLEKSGLRAISSSNELVMVASLGVEDDDDLDMAVDDAEEREEDEILEAIEVLQDALTNFLAINGGSRENDVALFDEKLIAATLSLVDDLQKSVSEVVELAGAGATPEILFEAREELEDVEFAFLAHVDAMLLESGQRFRINQSLVLQKIESSTYVLIVAGIIAFVVAVVTAVTASGRIIAIMAELKTTLEKLANQKHALEDTQQQLVRQEKMATLGQLTATVSHELRNPLGAARTSLYLIRQKAEKMEIDLARPIERAERSILRCDGIIAELLDFARESRPNLAAVQVEGWLAEELDAYTPANDVEIQREFLIGGARVGLDTERFRRVLVNLLDNACDALGGKDNTRRIVVRTEECQGQIHISIADNGSGISKTDLERIFEPLFSTKSFGVGLGLPTVKKIVQGHGGEIHMTSEVGHGTTVVITLPVAGDKPPTRSTNGATSQNSEMVDA